MSSVKSNTSGTEVSELLEAFDDVIKTLGPMRKQIGKLLGAKKRRTAKDPDAEPGESRSAWQEWAKICSKRFAEAYAAHLLEVDKKADVMTFAKKCRDKSHVAEWTAFEAEWSAAHPKAEAKPKKAEAKPAKSTKSTKSTKPAKAAKDAEVIGSDAEGVLLGSDAESSASKKGKKAKAVESDAESSTSKKSKKKDPLPSASPAPKTKAPVKKGSAKDEKAAAKAALAEASLAAAKADPPTERTYRGRKYMVNSANQVWAMGEDGEVGDWVGLLAEDGKKLEKTDGPA
jgi:hypothetical protein